jgi:hypothetical protein
MASMKKGGLRERQIRVGETREYQQRHHTLARTDSVTELLPYKGLLFLRVHCNRKIHIIGLKLCLANKYKPASCLAREHMYCSNSFPNILEFVNYF